MSAQLSKDESKKLQFIKDFITRTGFTYNEIAIEYINEIYDIFNGKIKPDYEDGFYYSFIAFYYQATGNVYETEKYYKIAVEKDKNSSCVKYNYGNLCYKKGDIVKAEKYLLMAIGQGNLHAMHNYGIICEQRGDSVGAEKYYLMAIEGGNKSSIFGLLKIFDKKGKNMETLRMYVKLFDITKDESVLGEMKKFMSVFDMKRVCELVKSEELLQNRLDEREVYRKYLREFGAVGCIIISYI